MGQRLAKKVLLIGWDAADWNIIKPLLDRDLLPTLNRLIGQGLMGDLASIRPLLSPMLWTSIATGKRPDKHGICSFVEPDLAGQGIRPVTSTSRRCKALWNLLTQQGLKTHVIGWFASHPAEPINGVSVSDLFAPCRAEWGEPWPVPAGSVYPESLTETLAGLRIHPCELQMSDLLPFVPRAEQIDQVKDRRLMGLGQILAECASVHAAATWVLQNEAWDFLAVYYNAIDHFCHQFMYYHPPRMDHIPPEDFDLYKNVVYSAYCFHDLLLARLLQLAGEETTVLLVSDHGYHCDHLRPLLTPAEQGGPAAWHRQRGIVVLQGPHLRQDELLFGANLLDVTPTVLTLFGLPVGEDMDGRPWLHAFEKPVAVESIPSWEALPGACGMHPPERRQDPFEGQAVLQHLADLGYIEPPAEDARQAAERATQEARYNLARSLLDAGRPAEALPLLEKLYSQQPTRLLLVLDLTSCYHALGRLADCRRLVEYLAEGNCTQAVMDGPGGQIVPQVDMLFGMLAFAEGRTEEALAHLRKVEQIQPRLRGLNNHLGQAYLRMGRWVEAQQAFEKELAIDTDSAAAHHGLAVALLQQDRDEDAADHALTAVGLVHHFPLAHYHLGVAVQRLGMLDRAVQAYETSLSMAPNLAQAHHQLAILLPRVTGDMGRAAAHQRRANELMALQNAGRG